LGGAFHITEFWLENVKEDAGVGDGDVKMRLKEVMGLWTALICLWTGACGGLLWTE
jgi:hypothetical protein